MTTAATNKTFTTQDFKAISEIDDGVRRLLELKLSFDGFKLGDVFIEEYWDKRTPEKVQVRQNHMGFPVKYKVVHISPAGIPFLQKLNAKGVPNGIVHTPPQLWGLKELLQPNSLSHLWEHSKVDIHSQEYEANIYYGFRGLYEHRYIPDPEQLDAILLDQDFDPTAAHKDKLKLFSEINKHNKSIAIPTSWGHEVDILKYILTLKPGDKFWMGTNKCFIVQRVDRVVTNKPQVANGRQPVFEYVVAALNTNKETKKFTPKDLMNKRLYSAQPRSFKQESAA